MAANFFFTFQFSVDSSNYYNVGKKLRITLIQIWVGKVIPEPKFQKQNIFLKVKIPMIYFHHIMEYL